MKHNLLAPILRGSANSPLGMLALRLTLLALCALWSQGLTFAVGSWVAMTTSTNDNIQICLLLPDGTVMAEGNNNNGTSWYSLSPDSNGHYVDGTWGPRARSNWGHQTGSTEVLNNGNVFVGGGENGNGTNKIEIYNPSSDSWTVAVNPTYFGNIYDGNAMLMPDGQVLLEPQNTFSSYSQDTFLFNPANNSISQTTGAPLSGIGEGCWVKLPNNNILVIDSADSSVGATTAEQYDPYTEIWGDPDSGVPNIWPNVTGTGDVSESGPAFLLPNGNAVFFGGNGATAVYDDNNDTWSSSAHLPGTLGQKDAPGAMMVNGKVLLGVSPQGVNSASSAINGIGPSSFYEYDYTANGGAGGLTQAPNAPPGYSQIQSRAGSLFMLDLPDGTVLLSGIGSQCWIYQPDGSPLAAGKPAIDKVQWNGNGTLHITGTLFNGISQGASYGDDSQMDSNWPLLRFTDSSGNVSYGSTYNWSSTGVATGNQVVTTEANLSTAAFQFGGAYSIQIVANGIASDPVSFYGPTWVDFVNYNIFLENGWFDFPYSTLSQGVSAVPSGGTIAIDASSSPSTGHESVPYTISTPSTIISVYGPSTISN
jgi:hypothetical protein